LREVKSGDGFQIHPLSAIFHDEVGVYDEDAAGKPVYNFPTLTRFTTVC